MSVDRSSNNPLYLNLASDLRKDIEQGVYGVGDRMPSEPDLCESTGFSRSTVRKALQTLVDEGYVAKSQGKGTFVLTRHPERRSSTESRAHFRGFTENARDMGADPSTRAVDFRVETPTPGLVDFFGLGPEDKVVEICRLRLVDGAPACVETIWLPQGFVQLEQEDLDGSLYELLETRFGIRRGGGTKSFGICYANHRESFLLDVPLGTALMLAEDRVLDSDGNPLHVSKTVARDDKVRYSFELRA